MGPCIPPRRLLGTWLVIPIREADAVEALGSLTSMPGRTGMHGRGPRGLGLSST